MPLDHDERFIAMTRVSTPFDAFVRDPATRDSVRT
jgi:hypothetical protein